MGPITIAVAVAIISLFLFICAIAVIRSLIHVCEPNQVLIFSGATRQVGRRQVGYRLVRGGRGIRTPLFETVHRMDLTNMAIELTARNAYSRGGIPLTVQAVANIKIAGDEPTICNSIERFLGKPREEIMRIGKETLEGNLRGVLASLTPEQLNEDKAAFEEQLLKEAEVDLTKLGLVLDSLKIQNITDEVGYLDSIGRRQTADLQRRSRIAEARNTVESVVQDAANQRTTALAQIEAQINIARAESRRRILDAQSRGVAMVAESRAEVSTAVAKAKAELDVQRNRIEQVRRRLQADIVEPAMARRKELEADARAKAFPITESARANAEVLKEITRTWHQAGPNARQIFLLQKIEPLIKTMVGTIRNVEIDKITLIDRGVADIDQNGSLPMKVASASEQLRETLGVDVPALARGLAAAATSRT